MRNNSWMTVLLMAASAVGCGGGGGATGGSGPSVAALQIRSQPASQAIQLGLVFGLSVDAVGPGTLTYQWFRNGVALLGATSSAYSIGTAAASDGGSYSVVVSDATGNIATSTQAVITISSLSADQSFSQVAPRIVVAARQGRQFKLPSESTDWTIQYKFIVPPVPIKTWSPTVNVFYVWGDIDFDQYGQEGNFSLSGYKFNQIVPQAFIGRVLSGNDANYIPSWSNLTGWAIQAQYFWQKDSKPYAQTGSIVSVTPGELVTTTIQYSAASGAIVASIASNNGTSTITIPRPFPNEPALFSSWRDFFQRAQAKTGTNYVWSQPVMNIEPGGGADKQTICTLLPFDVRYVSLPGLAANASSYAMSLDSGLPCSTTPVTLAF